VDVSNVGLLVEDPAVEPPTFWDDETNICFLPDDVVFTALATLIVTRDIDEGTSWDFSNRTFAPLGILELVVGWDVILSSATFSLDESWLSDDFDLWSSNDGRALTSTTIAQQRKIAEYIVSAGWRNT
jgi:hypothetical protein